MKALLKKKVLLLSNNNANTTKPFDTLIENNKKKTLADCFRCDGEMFLFIAMLEIVVSRNIIIINVNDKSCSIKSQDQSFQVSNFLINKSRCLEPSGN